MDTPVDRATTNRRRSFSRVTTRIIGISNRWWIASTHLNKPWDVLGWIFPFPLLDGGAVGGCGSLADRWTNAGGLLLCLAVPAGAVPGIISMLELSLDELSVCWSKVKINLISPAIECSREDTCRDSWSILAFISSIGRPGPLWKSPEHYNVPRSVRLVSKDIARSTESSVLRALRTLA